MKIADALAAATRRLDAAGVEGAARDARWLMAHVLDCDPGLVSARASDDLTGPAADRFAAAISAREARKPVSQITGKREFWGREFRVTPDTLDPRPDTETLIAEALSKPFNRVLDLGTGTGAILVTLLAERPEATGTGTDISEAALAVARENANRHGVASRADFRRADWFGGVDGDYDLIVSNPPYIAAVEMDGLDPEVRLWEPAAALTDGADGLTAYRTITAAAPHYLKPGGRLIVEIGSMQAEAVSDAFTAAGFRQIRVIPDLAGLNRVVSGEKP